MRNLRTRGFVPISTHPTHSREPGASTSGARADWWMMRACVRRPRANWPERLVARLLEPARLSEAERDRVFWVNACAGDASCCTRRSTACQDYARHTALLGQARGPIGSRTRAFLEILCAFQGVFVASGIVVDESTEAADRGAVEIEDAPRVDF